MYCPKLSGWSLPLQGKRFLNPYELCGILLGVVTYTAKAFPKSLTFSALSSLVILRAPIDVLFVFRSESLH